MDIEIKEKEKNEKKKMVALELSESLYQKLRKEAFDKEVSLSAIIRLACEMMILSKDEEQESC